MSPPNGSMNRRSGEPTEVVVRYTPMETGVINEAYVVFETEDMKKVYHFYRIDVSRGRLAPARGVGLSGGAGVGALSDRWRSSAGRRYGARARAVGACAADGTGRGGRAPARAGRSRAARGGGVAAAHA